MSSVVEVRVYGSSLNVTDQGLGKLLVVIFITSRSATRRRSIEAEDGQVIDKKIIIITFIIDVSAGIGQVDRSVIRPGEVDGHARAIVCCTVI